MTKVRELQNLAFPSLLASLLLFHLHLAPLRLLVLSTKIRSAGLSQQMTMKTKKTVPASMFLPHAKPSTLAFQAAAAPKASESVEIEVQQALAADTIDDVLGDLF
eukprot:CCRYP_020841-RA/>CCRYP_020841-RA protein AED:0.41 eAED:0.42 QI:0/0/0/1/0/0/2/0/104